MRCVAAESHRFDCVHGGLFAGFLRIQGARITAPQPLAVGLGQSPRRVDQRRSGAHQDGSRSNDNRIRLRLRSDVSPTTATADRCAPTGPESGHPADRLWAALADQAHVARMRHDGFVSQPAQQPAYSRRMQSPFQRDAAARHGGKPGRPRARLIPGRKLPTVQNGMSVLSSAGKIARACRFIAPCTKGNP